MASAAKHTPGPWQSQHAFDIDGVLTIIGNVDGPDDGQYHYTRVADVADTRYDAEMLANARLIAASPDLLDALELMVSAHPVCSHPMGGEGSPVRRQQEEQRAAVVKARAVIAQARGAS